MAQKYYNVKEAAQVLGATEDAVRQMMEHRELYGYRDGADWKFKAEDIERLAADRKAQSTPHVEDTDEVILSEVELGQSGPGSSGTVIGMEPIARAESDINLASSSKIDVTGQSVTPPISKGPADSKAAKFEELNLALEEDLTLPASTIGLDAKKPMPAAPSGGSSLVIAPETDDDNVVIGGGSSGSGITLSGDSGISLVDPADSGLSLEEPLDLGGSVAEESLELGEEDMLQLAESSKSHSALKADDDFLLTPMEETTDTDESESGSQVIALESESEEGVTLAAPEQGAGIFGEIPGADLGAGVALGTAPLGAGLGISPGAMAEGAAVAPAGAYLPEAPYSTWNIVFLSICLFFIMLCGAMVYDLVRNMWSWNSAGSVNTWLMDTIIGLFER
jgi:excisionase family DNA binding protein